MTTHDRARALLDALETELAGVGYGKSSLAEIASDHLRAVRGIVDGHEAVKPPPRTFTRILPCGDPSGPPTVLCSLLVGHDGDHADAWRRWA